MGPRRTRRAARERRERKREGGREGHSSSCGQNDILIRWKFTKDEDLRIRPLQPLWTAEPVDDRPGSVSAHVRHELLQVLDFIRKVVPIHGFRVDPVHNVEAIWAVLPSQADGYGYDQRHVRGLCMPLRPQVVLVFEWKAPVGELALEQVLVLVAHCPSHSIQVWGEVTVGLTALDDLRAQPLVLNSAPVLRKRRDCLL